MLLQQELVATALSPAFHDKSTNVPQSGYPRISRCPNLAAARTRFTVATSIANAFASACRLSDQSSGSGRITITLSRSVIDSLGQPEGRPWSRRMNQGKHVSRMSVERLRRSGGGRMRLTKTSLRSRSWSALCQRNSKKRPIRRKLVRPPLPAYSARW